MRVKNILFTTVGLLFFITAEASDFIVKNGRASLVVNVADRPVVESAAQMLAEDWQSVFDKELLRTKISDVPQIICGVIGDSILVGLPTDERALRGRHEAFAINVSSKGCLVVSGSDAHGLAYGLLEVSRMIGVSPWTWWADSRPSKLQDFRIGETYHCLQAPSVEYRGIFINDEDWGLTPWSYTTNEPAEKGVVGPRTTEEIFRLLLRLRANTYWPPMHSCSRPFFLTEGNREVAAKYGIYIGTSHCEPMGCNANGEWNVRGEGDYNFKTNRASVMKFWEERVKSTACQEMIYTLGMRGVHDSGILGARNATERKELTQEVIDAQRTLIAEHVNEDVGNVPQVFIPYKEVLEAYNDGLQIPDDVTLMWCDDNYGYLRHFPTEAENRRSGGNGLYYHISYWGRPHDYLWLCTFSPAHLTYELSKAYDSGIRKMWILNVGDIKPAEYQTELFMDMAWDIESVRRLGVEKHLESFMRREFGGKVAKQLAKSMLTYYNLSHIARPEFLGHTRTEEKDPKYKIVNDMPWSREYVEKRLQEYDAIAKTIVKCGTQIAIEKQTTFYHLVSYPLWSANMMNRKMLTGMLARHGLMSFAEARLATDSIVRMTERYNVGKWRGIMDANPRKLPVFEPIKEVVAETALVEEVEWETIRGADAKGAFEVLKELGHSRLSAEVVQGESVVYTSHVRTSQSDSLEIEICLLPTHSMTERKEQLIDISVDGQAPISVDYHTEGRSEEWKENVLRNLAIRTLRVKVGGGRRHKIRVDAVSPGVVVDMLRVRKL